MSEAPVRAAPPARAALDVSVWFGASLVRALHLDPPRSVAIGNGAAVDVELEGLDAPVPLVRIEKASVIVEVPEGADAQLVAAGGETAIAGPCVLPFGASARLSWRGLAIEIALGEAPSRVRSFPRPSRALAFAAASVAAHAALLVAAARAPRPTHDEIEADRVETIRALLHLTDASADEVERADDAAKASTDVPTLEGGRATSRYGVEGPRADDPHRARGEALREATEFGMIGLMSAGSGAWGTAIGDAFGAGGLGLSGVGAVGGGAGFGSGHGRLGGAHASAGGARFAGVRAGEWDDNANYREFGRFLASMSAVGFHPVPVDDRQFVIVRDAASRPVPGCDVTFRDANGRRTTFRTGASGRVVLFPHGERLAGTQVQVTATCREGTASATLPIVGADHVVTLDLAAERERRATRAVDVAFVLDTTGSMSEEIAAVKATIAKVASALAARQTAVRLGMVEYKDRTDPFVTRIFPMTSDVGAFANEVAHVSASGGGDTPESANEALHTAVTKLAFSDDAVARLAFLVGDAPPHLDYEHDFDYAVDLRAAAHAGIHVYTIAASGMDALGQVVWRQIAQYTDGTNMFVLRGGAGPQSVGAGDPIASCGGRQTSYATANLDALVLAKIDGELAALDGNPLRIAGLGRDEKAKPCPERVARQ